MNNLKKTKQLFLILGPVLSICLIVFFDLKPGNPAVTRTAAVALLMAIWWITEAIPIAVTALLPVVLFPLLGIMKGKAVAPIYFNHIIFLFIGGFIVALAMQRWGVHKRIALKILLLIGASPKRMILGFMVATWFLSMWVSNTATTMMMVPIVLAVILNLEERFGKEQVSKFTVGLLLSVAYAASIGGIATLIGTPPNLSFARILTIMFPKAPELEFATWLYFALPISVVFLVFTWWVLSWMFCTRSERFEADTSIFREEYKRLGPTSFEQYVVLIIFSIMAILWMTRRDITIGQFVIPGWASLIGVAGYIDDGTIAMKKLCENSLSNV